MKNNMHSINGIQWDKLAKYFAGECSERESDEIQSWIQADPSRVELIETMRAVWEESGKHAKEFDTQSFWRKVAVRSNVGTTPVSDLEPAATRRLKGEPDFAGRWNSTLRYTLRIAAVLVLLVGLPYVVYKVIDGGEQSSGETTMREISTQMGERAQFRFSDGTKIWLNAASSVRFPANFSGDAREIALRGEAYFEVTHRDGVPFVVRTGNGIVQVLGTEFNVRARPEDNHTSVVVAGGKVSLRKQIDDRGRQVILTKGQTSSISPEGLLATPINVNVERLLGWTKGRLVFEKTPLSVVMTELGRWYDLDCSLADTALGHKQLTAAFSGEPVREVLGIIAASADLDFEMNGRSVIFTSPEKR